MTIEQLDKLIDEIRKEYELATDHEAKERFAKMAVGLKRLVISIEVYGLLDF